MNFFTSPEDLKTWVFSNESPEIAISNIVEVIGEQDILSVKDGINLMFNLKKQTKKKENGTDLDKDIEDASKSLFSVLAKHNLAGGTKTSIREDSIMDKKEANSGENIQKFNAADHFGLRKAQVTRPPSSPYTSREDSNKYVGTPWRIDRDSFYDFTHRNPDMLSFDDDPNRVYSGEAIWRRYVMDKFYRDYKDDEGRLVGGYINDRFQTFHDLGGNQMELSNSERTRKPRRHQWSIERRLSEGRGEETSDIVALTASENLKFTRVATKSIEEDSDNVVQAFADILDMHDAGFEEEDIITQVAGHYEMSMLKVADIKKLAYSMKDKFSGELYEPEGLEKEASSEVKVQVEEKYENDFDVVEAADPEAVEATFAQYHDLREAGTLDMDVTFKESLSVPTASTNSLKKKANIEPTPNNTWVTTMEGNALSVNQQNVEIPTAGFVLPTGTKVTDTGVTDQMNRSVFVVSTDSYGKQARFVLSGAPAFGIERIANQMEDLPMAEDNLDVDYNGPNSQMTEQVENRAGLETTSSNKDTEGGIDINIDIDINSEDLKKTFDMLNGEIEEIEESEDFEVKEA
jgi:hypothetical protein